MASQHRPQHPKHHFDATMATTEEWDDDTYQTAAKSILGVERDLGLPKGFVARLHEEDDWSFVIKLHALVEAATSHLLSEVVDSRLDDVFSFLELSNKRTGKLAFIGALDLLSKPIRRYISALSELRNVLVHNVRNVGFEFDSYIASLNKEQRRNFVSSFGRALKDPEIALTQPKMALWVGGCTCLAVLGIEAENAALRRRLSS